MATKMKGLFKGLKYISQLFVQKEHEMEIGYPTDVRHVTHIGWDHPYGSAPAWAKIVLLDILDKYLVQLSEFKTSSDYSSASLSNLGQSRETSWASQVFVYPPGQDSVLQVEKESYETCNTTTYIQKFDDGNTVFTFNRSGAFYFISGNEANCMKNESLVVVVLAQRSQPGSPPSPSPVSSSLSPPPSPASSSPPSPPPSSSTEVTPSSAPTGEETGTPPRPNGASFKVVAFMGSVGAFLGWLLFVF